MKHRKRVRKATVNYCKMCKMKYHTMFTIIEQVAQPKTAIYTHLHTHTHKPYTQGETHTQKRAYAKHVAKYWEVLKREGKLI